MTGLAVGSYAYAAATLDAPEALGFASQRLARISAWQRGQVDPGAFSGAVAAIARNGKLVRIARRHSG